MHGISQDPDIYCSTASSHQIFRGARTPYSRLLAIQIGPLKLDGSEARSWTPFGPHPYPQVSYDHAVTASPYALSSGSTEVEREEDGSTKRQRLGGKKVKNPDFINSSPLMESTTTIPQGRTVLQTLYGKFSTPVQFPRLPAANGTLQTLCLNSSFAAPHHTCTTRLCGDRKSTPRTPRLHIDLSKDLWKNKPESYWAPMVTFLQCEMVSQHIRPTKALQQLTLSTKWI
jgi:hypothetical protein